ncbi:Iron(II)-dependent oxidoreductase EgtB [Pseudobythopirellula maris]|uniref:Iron(II)-dependent oxidoreductase EgtB n=1 Tax=Pseudobythopirellula maris TaxID=2527991 RepID=A0A5C5ZTA7_9BACT|nr:ergothioneine biosynthesis protein EgtB [Pseudobythopirellula maris]TWT90480.1 Iron(II)-dependent oxidoreductase EgtB [Pseudobythopirellula maris]
MSVLQTSAPAQLTLAERYRAVRGFSEQLAAPLSAEDCAMQSAPDASPTKWHLAHTTWFFETFVLGERQGYEPFCPAYRYLYNSYYNAVGNQFPRPQRGLLSRPSLAEVEAYRSHVDAEMNELFDSGAFGCDEEAQAARVIEIGLQHEQQHQELILTDIQHALSINPLQPVYREGDFLASGPAPAPRWVAFDEGVRTIGHVPAAEGAGFAFDNESPRHRVFLEPFELCDRLVTCGEYLEFIEDGGYRRPELWLSLGWAAVQEHAWRAPAYWRRSDEEWRRFTLAGERRLDPHQPVACLSYFEADAYARWAGARLPTEAEWEVAASAQTTGAPTGRFVDGAWQAGEAICPRRQDGVTTPLRECFGEVWQWTSSSYSPYPGYTAPDGALGEYNGKFMCNQYVLRGASCATSSSHARLSYRNFFAPEARWQFSGLRLAR